MRALLTLSAYSLHRNGTPRYLPVVSTSSTLLQQGEAAAVINDLPLTRSEWVTHQHRDTLAGIVGHPPLLAYLSVADGECQARERFEVIEVS